MKTHFMCSIFFKLCLYEIKWKNVEPGRPQMTKRPMHIACWLTKAKGTHLKYVIIVAFPLQQRLQGGASVLRYT
jgi:hypothetical protein